MSAVGPERSKIAPTLMSSLAAAPEDLVFDALSFFLSFPHATPAPAMSVKQSGSASLLMKRFILSPSLGLVGGVSNGTAIVGSSPWPAARAGRGRGARTAGTRRARGRTASAARRAV